MAKLAIWMGHSGEEGGATGIVVEDNITRQAREWSVNYARACGHTVTTDNDNMSLSQRIFASDPSHAGILEWHANSGGGTGTEVWFSQYDTGRAQAIAKAMVALAPTYGFPNRGIHNSATNRYGRLGILDTPKPLALLVETMFVDTQDDVNDWNKNGKALVEAMTAAFLAGLGLKSTPSGKQPTPVSPTPSKPSLKPIATIAKEVINGAWGNGADRTAKLTAAGYNPATVQAEVNRQLGATSKPKPALKSIATVAKEVINGAWGNGADRTKRLTNAGYNAQAVQTEVNRQLGASSKPALKSVHTIALEVINGNWGNGADRVNRLKKAGYDPNAVQKEVNRIL